METDLDVRVFQVDHVSKNNREGGHVELALRGGMEGSGPRLPTDKNVELRRRLASPKNNCALYGFTLDFVGVPLIVIGARHNDTFG
jgi:hypothetical protein